MVFENSHPTDPAPKLEGESSWSYLKRSSRHDAKVVRRIIERWFANYPNEHQLEWLGQFRSDNEPQFRAASFELYLHVLLTTLGYEVQIHVDAPSKPARKIDFRVDSPNGAHFYLEATLSGLGSDADRSAQARQNAAIDELNKIQTSDFFVLLNIKQKPREQPSSTKIRSSIESWLSGLDPDEIAIDENSPALHLPSLTIDEKGWLIEVRAMPKREEARHKITARPVGSVSYGFSHDTSSEDMRDKIIRKGQRYGKFDAPFVVAVSPSSYTVDQEDVVDALFGQTAITLDPKGIGHQIRLEDGVWNYNRGRRRSRISAVFVINDLHPWTYGIRSGRLWHNPNAKYPISGPICTVPQAIVENERVTLHDGVEPARLLGLEKSYV